jgi:multidrug efflux pump subunit AcrA (membrane-fusion protein)
MKNTFFKSKNMLYRSKIVALIAVLILVSCAEETKVATFTTSLGDFTHSLMIEGFVEPVLSTTLSSPRYCDGVVEFLVEDGESVEEGQVVCIIDFQQLKIDYDQILISLENAETGFNKAKAQMNMDLALLEAQVRTNDADTKIAQMDSLQLAFMSLNQKRIKELELETASTQKERYEKKFNALKVIQQSEVRRWELQIQRIMANVQTTKERIDALTLKAPRSGLVIVANNPITGKKLQVGDPVWSNFPIATIPDAGKMKVKISAPESDFKMISVNDSVNFTFDAMPGNKGIGKILKKTPVGQPYKRGSTVKFFEIEASIDSATTLPDPGFTANCHIILKKAENVITIPQIALFDEDSIKIVFVQRKKKFEKQQVLTDVSSSKEAVIKTGLIEGEIIALSKPNLSLIKDLIMLPDSLTGKTETAADLPKPENTPGVPNMPAGMPSPLPQNSSQP